MMLYIVYKEAVNMPLELATSGSWSSKEHIIYEPPVQMQIGGIWIEVLFWLSMGMMGYYRLISKASRVLWAFFLP